MIWAYFWEAGISFRLRKIKKELARPTETMDVEILPWDLDDLATGAGEKTLFAMGTLDNWELYDWSPNGGDKYLKSPVAIGFRCNVAGVLELERCPDGILRNDCYFEISRSDHAVVSIREFKREDPSKRIGSGVTGLRLKVGLTPDAYHHLFEQAELFVKATTSRWPGDQVRLLLVMACREVVLPADRSMEPDGKLEDAFVWSACPEQIGYALLRVNDTGRARDTGDGFSTYLDIRANYDVLNGGRFVLQS